MDLNNDGEADISIYNYTGLMLKGPNLTINISKFIFVYPSEIEPIIGQPIIEKILSKLKEQFIKEKEKCRLSVSFKGDNVLASDIIKLLDARIDLVEKAIESNDSTEYLTKLYVVQ